MMAGGDLKPHLATYDRVIGMLKWGAIGCAIVALFIIWLIA